MTVHESAASVVITLRVITNSVGSEANHDAERDDYTAELSTLL